MPPLTHGVRNIKKITEMTLGDKQARPVFRILAGIISLIFYLLFVFQSIMILIFLKDGVFIWTLLFQPSLFLIFSPIAIAFTFLAITGSIPEILSRLVLGRKDAGMKINK